MYFPFPIKEFHKINIKYVKLLKLYITQVFILHDLFTVTRVTILINLKIIINFK